MEPEIDEGIAMRSILDLILPSISNHNHEELREYLNILPILRMKVDSSNEWLRIICLQSFDEDNGPALGMAIKYWSDNNPEEEIRPILIEIFRMGGFPNKFYTFLINQYPGLNFSHFIYKLNNFAPDGETIMAAQRIHKVFGPQSLEVLENLLDDLRCGLEEDLTVVINEFLKELIAEYNSKNVAPRPDWIIAPPFYINDQLPTNQDLDNWAIEIYKNLHMEGQINTHSVDLFAEGLINLYTEMINNSTKGVFSMSTHINPSLVEDPQKAKSIMLEKLKDMNLEDLGKKIDDVKELELSLRLEFTCLYGPSFLGTDARKLDSLNADPCVRFGGCRMFLCWEYENLDSDGEEIIEDIEEEDRYYLIDWFTGNCDTCGAIIQQKHYALRMPELVGGYSGCYCSFECLRFQIPEKNGQRVENFEKMETVVRKFGIYDRIWEKRKIIPIPSREMIQKVQAPASSQLSKFMEQSSSFEDESKVVLEGPSSSIPNPYVNNVEETVFNPFLM